MTVDLPDWKRDLPTFAQYLSNNRWKPYKHLKYISETIIKNLYSGGRFIINTPPRHGKSELISHWLPVWYLDAYPERWVLLSSYEASIATDWGRKVRDTLQNNECWTNIRQDVRAANRWYTPEGGGMVTCGVGGPLTGRGGNLLIIDDPIKNWEEAYSPTYRRRLIDWFNSTYYTRGEPNATMIVIQTRWHQNDLAGWLMAEHADDWTIINLPAIAEDNDALGRKPGEALCPERYDINALEKIKVSTGSKVWTSLYQQRPAPSEGSVFRHDWIRFWEELPAIERVIQSWDMAFKDSGSSSYVVGQIWGQAGANFYLLDQVREQMDFVRTLHAVGALSKKWPESRAKLIEDKANGPAIISALKSQLSGIKAISPRGSKESRANAVAPLWEAGNVFLPTPKLYPWVNDYIDELTTFPAAANDDQVDSTTQALSHLDDRKTQAIQDIKIPELTQASPWSMFH